MESSSIYIYINNLYPSHLFFRLKLLQYSSELKELHPLLNNLEHLALLSRHDVFEFFFNKNYTLYISFAF